jgi:hypothetical protein
LAVHLVEYLAEWKVVPMVGSTVGWMADQMVVHSAALWVLKKVAQSVGQKVGGMVDSRAAPLELEKVAN